MSIQIEALLELMRRLRDPEKGCPWDQAQTFETIAPYTIEEAYEIQDAIHRQDYDELKSELGDLLFQVVFHARMAQEQGLFTFEDVLEAIVDKMTRRHPHVFSDAEMPALEEQGEQWEMLKDQEQQDASASALDGVAITLPALKRAQKIQKKAARVGFDWPDIEGVVAKVHEELDELKEEVQASAGAERLSDEMGDLFFSCVNLARHLDLDAEEVLRLGTRKFEKRFRALEDHFTAEGKAIRDVSLAELESVWQAVKKGETGTK